MFSKFEDEPKTWYVTGSAKAPIPVAFGNDVNGFSNSVDAVEPVDLNNDLIEWNDIGLAWIFCIKGIIEATFN